MSWNGARIKQELHRFLEPRVNMAAKFLTGYIRMHLAENVGSVVPFVASKPGEWPYLWDGTLRDSVMFEPESWNRAWVVSDAVDAWMDVGHHFSADEEFGHFWHGWAWDWQTGRLVKVAEPHDVAPRSFMRRGLWECREQILAIIQGGGNAGAVAA